MLENIITNLIDAPRGTKNPIYGVALRGPLSQFFSAIYLKPLDDAFDHSDVVYLRYQDDILILCKTKRQMNHCRRRMMEVLQERRLSLSRKKSRMGSVQSGFHFLGIFYPPTQPEYSTRVIHANDDLITTTTDQALVIGGGGKPFSDDQSHQPTRIVPHPRTLRKARENIKCIVIDGASLQKTRNYLHRYILWWRKTSEDWQYDELLHWLIASCWKRTPTAIAASLLHSPPTLLRNPSPRDSRAAA